MDMMSMVTGNAPRLPMPRVGVLPSVANTRMTNTRHRAEDAELGVRIVGDVEVVLVEEVHQDGAEEAADHLCADIREYFRPGEFASRGKSQGDGGIEVRARIRAGDEYAAHDGESPSEGDDHPAASEGFGFPEGGSGDYAVTEKDQHQRADQFEKTLGYQTHMLFG